MKLSRIIFIVFGIVLPICVGALHLQVHFKELLTADIEAALGSSIPILGSPKKMWNTWGLMSFMMGASFIVIGLLNLSSYKRLSAGEAPPIGLILGMMVFLGSVIYAGYTFSAQPQLVGGIVGMLAMVVALVVPKGRSKLL